MYGQLPSATLYDLLLPHRRNPINRPIVGIDDVDIANSIVRDHFEYEAITARPKEINIAGWDIQGEQK